MNASTISRSVTLLGWTREASASSPARPLPQGGRPSGAVPGSRVTRATLLGGRPRDGPVATMTSEGGASGDPDAALPQAALLRPVNPGDRVGRDDAGAQENPREVDILAMARPSCLPPRPPHQPRPRPASRAVRASSSPATRPSGCRATTWRPRPGSSRGTSRCSWRRSRAHPARPPAPPRRP